MKKIKNYIQFIKENTMFQYNDMIDYTLLEDSATDQEIIDLCKKADMFGVKSVCVLPKHVSLAKEQLIHSKVLVCTVVSFPHGTDSTIAKLNETQRVINDGADEVDMVLNYPLLQKNYEDGFEELVYDVKTLVDECHKRTSKEGNPIVLKVIVESGLLTEEETEISTNICLEAGADFIKTSTGKVSVGAEMNKIQIMFDTIQNAGSNMLIKASGGVRTAEQINSMLGMVDRFGMGYAAVDKLNNLTVDNTSSY
jgi:deoxyribose-phosphate aldolase